MKKKLDNRISVNWEFVLNAESVHREWEVPTLPSTKHPVIKRLKERKMESQYHIQWTSKMVDRLKTIVQEF